MKKLFALLLALCMLSMAAFAETDTSVITWEDTWESMADLGIEGEFVSIDGLGIQLWIPDGLNAVDAPESDIDSYAAYFTDEDGEAVISVTYLDESSDMTFDDYKGIVEALEADDIAELTINGTEVLRYALLEQDSLHCVLVNADGYICEINMWPISGGDGAAAFVWALVASSITVE